MQSNHKQIDPKQTWERQNRYSLRKLSVGLVSVATSAVFFMNAGSVQAADNGVSGPVEHTDLTTERNNVEHTDLTTERNNEDSELTGQPEISPANKTPKPANTRGTATINYVDESGATVKTITATGFVGDRIDAGSYLPDRYTIAEKDQTSASGKLFEDSPATITVYVKPGSNQDLKNSNTKNTPSEDGTELPLSDGTAEGLREKVVGLTKDQYANNKISITNIQFNKDEVKDYDPAIVDPEDPSKNVQAPMDLQVTFDWEGIGLRKGDVLVTPMSDAFDSTVRLPLEKFSSASISDMGIIVLDYDKRKMYVEFRKDLDPSKVYHGSIKLGTFINRNYFTKLDNDKTLNIPKPNGDIVQKHLTVTYKDAPNYDNAYMQAIAQKMSKDETSSDVTWAVEVNPISKNSNDNKIGKNNMAYASIYITPNEINGVYPEYDGSGNVDATRPSYSESDLPVELVGAFKVYEAEISPSMGYKKLKELKRGVDYEVLDSNDPETPLDNYNDDTKQTSHAKNVYVINLKGDYTVTNKKFVVEYTTHHSNLVYDHGNDRGSSETQVRLYSLVTYTHANDQNQIERTYNRNEGRITEAFDGDIIGASVNVISSTVDTTGTTTDLRGSVVVTHVDATTGRVLKADGYAIDADGKEMRNVLVGTHYTTNPEYFDGYKFTSIAYDSDNPDGEVEQGVKHVIYQYVPVAAKGNVDVTYVTEDGKVLKATQLVFQDSQEVGTAYQTDQKEFTGYHFVRMGEFSAKATGEVTENLQHVVYVYKADPVQKKGSVDVKYVTKDGKVLEDTSVVKNNAPVGEDYSTKEKSFDGYHFVGMDKTSDPATGVVAEGTKHVIYVYEKDVTPEVKKGSVDVKYIAKDGTVLEDTKPVKENAPVGQDYNTEEKSFNGYHFVGMDKTSDPATGKVTEGEKHVIYVYERNQEKGTVIVHFVDEDGNKISDDVVNKKDVPTGEAYTTTPKDIPGYELDKTKIPSNKDGVVVKGTTEVTYVYHKTPEPTPTPNQPEKPSDETPNQPGQPTTKTPNQPEEPSTDTPNKPEEPSNENPTPEVPEDNTTTEKLVLKTHHKKTNKQTTISHNSHETVNNNSSVTKVNNSKARLPQTGEKANNAASLAGVTLLAGATALAVGMIMSKKKH